MPSALGSSRNDTQKRLFLGSSACLFFFAAVLPNAFQLVTAALLILTAGLALPLVKLNTRVLFLLLTYFAGASITVTYLIVGHLSGAPIESAQQVAIIYLLSPILWITICSALVFSRGDEQIKRSITTFTQMCIVSVAIYFILFLYVSPRLASIFIETPNISVRDGYAQSKMHVYGSLIFLTAGYFALPSIATSSISRTICFIGLPLVAIVSGRDALILSIFIGLVIGITVRATQWSTPWTINAKSLRNGSIYLLIAPIAIGAGVFLGDPLNIDLPTLTQRFVRKLLSGGGSERTGQLVALLEGIRSTMGFGAGHGIGVNLIRSDEFPWRYELVWVASIFRVGLVGGVVYALPFVFYGLWFLDRLMRRRLSNLQIFLFAGFSASFIASATNPYIEGFTFQWMYTLPILHLIGTRNDQSLIALGKLPPGHEDN